MGTSGFVLLQALQLGRCLYRRAYFNIKQTKIQAESGVRLFKDNHKKYGFLA